MHSKANPCLAVYGGSFDPIHNGHIETALSVSKIFNLHELYLLPCGQPVFKKLCRATPNDRLEMLHIATKEYPHIKVDAREILKTTPSYTIESLKEFRLENHSTLPILFILGQDAFQNFFKWHRWQAILDYSHLIILKRAAFDINYTEKLQRFLEKHRTTERQDLFDSPHGRIYEIFAGDYPYSSTKIREALKRKESPEGLNKNVLHYIQQNHLYV